MCTRTFNASHLHVRIKMRHVCTFCGRINIKIWRLRPEVAGLLNIYHYRCCFGEGRVIASTFLVPEASNGDLVRVVKTNALLKFKCHAEKGELTRRWDDKLHGSSSRLFNKIMRNFTRPSCKTAIYLFRGALGIFGFADRRPGIKRPGRRWPVYFKNAEEVLPFLPTPLDRQTASARNDSKFQTG